MTTTFDIMTSLRARGLLHLVRPLAASHYVTIGEVLGRTRTSAAVRARQALWNEIYKLGLSLPQIGKLFDRDHTTILRGIQKHRKAQS